MKRFATFLFVLSSIFLFIWVSGKITKPDMCLNSGVVKNIYTENSEGIEIRAGNCWFSEPTTHEISWLPYWNQTSFLMSELEVLRQRIGGFKSLIEIHIHPKREFKFDIQGLKIEVGREIFSDPVSMRRVFIRSWMQQNMDPSIHRDPLLRNIVVDLLYYWAYRKIEYIGPKREDSGPVDDFRFWTESVLTTLDYCHSKGIALDFLDYCETVRDFSGKVRQGKIQLKNSPVAAASYKNLMYFESASLQKLASSIFLSSFRSIPVGEKMDYFSSFIKKIKTKNWNSFTTDESWTGLSPTEVFMPRMKEIADATGDLALSTRIMAGVGTLIRRKGFVAQKEDVRFDYFIQLSSPPSEKELRSSFDAAIKNGKSILFAYEDNYWINGKPLRLKEDETFKVNYLVKSYCQPPSLKQVSDERFQPERVVAFFGCEGIKMKNYELLPQGKVKLFSKVNSQFPVIKFHVPSLRLGLKSVKEDILIKPDFGPELKSRLKSIFGWAQSTWNKEFAVYKVDSQVEGIEWFRGSQSL